MKIILGSQSAGRQKMLAEMGYEFTVIAPEIDEKSIRHRDPKELTLTLARAKAQALQAKIFEPAILITSDQVVLWKGELREKPANEREAREFLQGYNEAPSENITAVVVTNLANGQQAAAVDVATVYFYPFSESDIDEFIKEGGVYNWAGAFTIEGPHWAAHVKSIEGTRDSVIGLPKELTRRLLKEVSAS